MTENLTSFTNGNSTLGELGTVFSDPPFAMFFAILDIIILATGILLALTIVATLLSTTIPLVVRVFILNQLIACTIYQISPAMFLSTSVVLSAMGNVKDNMTPSLAFCQFQSWVLAFGASGRSWSLAIFAVFALIITVHGAKKVKVLHAALAVGGAWVLSFLLCAYIMVPFPQYKVYAVQYFDNVQCFPLRSGVSIAVSISSIVVWISFAALLPLVIAVTIPIITLCYIKRNTVSDGKENNKTIAKFALFLLSGNVVNIVARAVPIIISLLFSDVAGIAVSLSLVSLSTTPTVIIVICFMKAVREDLKNVITCKCLRSHSVASSSSTKAREPNSCANQIESSDQLQTDHTNA
jgi:hypothetical protein